MRWQNTVYIVVVMLWPGNSTNPVAEIAFLPGKSVINIIPEFLAQSGTASTVAQTVAEDFQFTTTEELSTDHLSYDSKPEPPDPNYQVHHAGLPLSLAAYPLALQNSDHELQFNVSWVPSVDAPAEDYSLEVSSVTDTVDCNMPMCYEYNIPGDAQWWTIPAYSNPVAETCAVRPGCAYQVRLIAHPWDGHTAANLLVELDECVSGVCSCAHAPRLPAPIVTARVVTINEQHFANVTWVLPPPRFLNRLPRGLNKKHYSISIGRQMVSDAYPSPWYANIVNRQMPTHGPIATGDVEKWLVLPISEQSVERSDKRVRKIVADVKLLARVSVIDDRGCLGPAGNATAYDPAAATKTSFGTYALWAAFGGVCVLAMGAVIAVSLRAAKRVLNAFRPAPVSVPLDPLRCRPAWFPLPLRS